MEIVCKHTASELLVNKNQNRYDPTHTTMLRNNMVHESNRYFNELVKVIREVVIKNDIFGLNPRIHTFQELPEKAFQFSIDAKKIEEFTYWLEKRIRRGLLNGWPNKYISDAYKKGILRALSEMRKARYKVPFIGKVGEEEIAMTLSSHINTLELLYVRVYSELKGITSQMEQQISRILAQGFVKGESNTVMARKLVAAINGKGVGDLSLTDTIGRFIPARRRAEILIRTEISRAHHLAMINEFRRWGVNGVNVIAEWQTMKDDHVCVKCAYMEGKTFTLDEIEGMIPAHPNCRCIAVPLLLKN